MLRPVGGDGLRLGRANARQTLQILRGGGVQIDDFALQQAVRAAALIAPAPIGLERDAAVRSGGGDGVRLRAAVSRQEPAACEQDEAGGEQQGPLLIPGQIRLIFLPPDACGAVGRLL